ncbi:MAG: peptidylprolyl isomerase, partial [Paenibacillus sp.]|nr:peptidylprolyl isomerase [Paenibacillus sp.]
MLPINRSKSARRISVALASLLVAALALTGCGKDKNSAAGANAGSTEVVATYKDGGKVTRGEYDSFVGSVKFFNPMYAQFETDPTFQDHMMKQLIAFRVLGQQADEPSKKEAETKSKEQIDQIKSYFEQQGGD